MKFTPEQLATFAAAGWSPEAIKEMLEYDTEVQQVLENKGDIKPEDIENHIEDPKPQTKKEEKQPEEFIENMLDGGK